MTQVDGVYDWSEDGGVSEPSFPRAQRPRVEEDRDDWGRGGDIPRGRSRHTHKEKTYNVNVGTAGGGSGRSGSGGGGTPAGGGAVGDDRHQGDRLIYQVERIEFRSDKDIVALAKAINHLGRELHLILGMRAEELNGVLSQYKGKWYTFGTASRVKARLVSAHLKVSAEAAKALGVGALKMAYAFDRHFVKPEQEEKQRRQKPARPTFTIGDDH